MTKSRMYLLGICMFVLGGSIAALRYSKSSTPQKEEMSPGFFLKSYVNADREEVNYSIFVPPDLDKSKQYPVIVFLHGYGERGMDGLKPLKSALAPSMRWNQRKGKLLRFICVFPQGLTGSWYNPDDQRTVMDTLAIVEKEYNTDPKRVYLTGNSSGGSGVWTLAAKYPSRWAAIVPVCGAIPKDTSAPFRGELKDFDFEKVKKTPVWCFHGAIDPTTPVAGVRTGINELKKIGGKVKYTEYPKLTHFIWDYVYYTDELYDWLAEQKLP
jgi:predicted peptidase